MTPNLIQQQHLLQGLPDVQLQQMLQRPTGEVPQFLVLAELQRRKQMRAASAPPAPQGTMVDEAMAGAGDNRGGIASMAQQPLRMAEGGAVYGSQNWEMERQRRIAEERQRALSERPVSSMAGRGLYRSVPPRVVVPMDIPSEDTNFGGYGLPMPEALPGGPVVRDGLGIDLTAILGAQQQSVPSPEATGTQPPGRGTETLPPAPIGLPSLAVGQIGRSRFRPILSPADAPTVRSYDDYLAELRGGREDYLGPQEERLAKMRESAEANAKRDPWMALAEAGLAMAGSKSPYFAQAASEGGLKGLASLRESQKEGRTEALKLLGVEGENARAKMARAAQEQQGALAARNADQTARGQFNSALVADANRESSMISANASAANAATQAALAPYQAQSLMANVDQSRVMGDYYRAMVDPEAVRMAKSIAALPPEQQAQAKAFYDARTGSRASPIDQIAKISQIKAKITDEESQSILTLASAIQKRDKVSASDARRLAEEEIFRTKYPGILEAENEAKRLMGQRSGLPSLMGGTMPSAAPQFRYDNGTLVPVR